MTARILIDAGPHPDRLTWPDVILIAGLVAVLAPLLLVAGLVAFALGDAERVVMAGRVRP